MSTSTPPTFRERIDPYWPRPDPTATDGPDPYGNPDPEWLQVDWSEHLGWADVDRTRVNYVELGQGPQTVVFVHGLSGCWQNWLEQLPVFAREHRVLALDLPGFGDSPPPEWEISIPAYGRLLCGFCDALEVRDAAVVGSSMGGFVAAEAVINEPERFERLALVSAAGVSSARLRREPTEVAGRMLAAAAPLMFQLQTRAFRRVRARKLAFAGLFRHPLLLRRELLWEFFHGGERAEMFTEALGSLAGYDFLDRLDEIEVPTLIVWGRNDRVVPPMDALEYHRRVRNSELVIFDECGHLPMAERPTRFNRLLEAFLSS